MNLSYWEYTSWLTNLDFVVVGSGIVGLNCAIALKEQEPKANVLVLEKGILPQGASTKNAGFACYGSISELLNDRKHHTDQELLELVKSRKEGIVGLQQILGNTVLGYEQKGGHEIFLKTDQELFETCLGQLAELNELLEPVFGKTTFKTHQNIYGYGKICPLYITQIHEGQLHTGNMMKALLAKAHQMGVTVLNGIQVLEFAEKADSVAVRTQLFHITCKNLLIATNGFARQLIPEAVRPARAQVLITEPVARLKIDGTFHLDQGYYYFRNIDGRILLGGGRNLDFKTEETYTFGQTEKVQKRLHQLLAEVILPGQPFEIAQQWSGIMGVGPKKKPIVKRLSPNVACGVRLGGMGVAIGADTGRKLAKMAL